MPQAAPINPLPEPVATTKNLGVSTLGQNPDVASVLVCLPTTSPDYISSLLNKDQHSPDIPSYVSHGISSMPGLHKLVFQLTSLYHSLGMLG